MWMIAFVTDDGMERFRIGEPKGDRTLAESHAAFLQDVLDPGRGRFAVVAAAAATGTDLQESV